MSDIAHVIARAAADGPHTLSVLALAGALPDAGAGAVYSAATGSHIDGVKSLSRLAAGDRSLLVYHQRGPAPALARQLATRGGRLAVVDNGGPKDPLAFRDLRVLASAGAVGIATSTGAAARLTGLGFERVELVPPVVAGTRLAAVEAFGPTAHHLDVALHGPLVTSVSDIATASNSARVVQAYHVLRTYLVGAGHLVIAVPESPDTSEAALQSVHREIWGLRLTDAWLQRLGSAGERAALTRRAAVFVTADPAAGDCESALAAMAEGVPVVAPADASAAAVLGDGALLLPTDAGATLVAEAVAALLSDAARRAEFAAAASRVADRYGASIVAPAWRAALAA